MNKILTLSATFVLTVFSWISCSKEDDAPFDEIPSEENPIEKFLKANNLEPSEKENINYIGGHFAFEKSNFVLGERNHRAWISRFDTNGKELYSFEVPQLPSWKYSYYNSNSKLLINHNYLFLRGWYVNIAKRQSLDRFDYEERFSIFNLDHGKEIEYVTYKGSTRTLDYHIAVYTSNQRSLVIRNADSNPPAPDVFYVIGVDGKILYSRTWGNSENEFFKPYKFAHGSDVLLFWNDEIVSPMVIKNSQFTSYKVINIKEWKLVKEIGYKEGLKPFGDRIDQKNIIYLVDTTYINGENVKFVYNELLVEKDEISGIEKHKLLDKYYYNINMSNYSVTYMGKEK